MGGTSRRSIILKRPGISAHISAQQLVSSANASISLLLLLSTYFTLTIADDHDRRTRPASTCLGTLEYFVDVDEQCTVSRAMFPMLPLSFNFSPSVHICH